MALIEISKPRNEILRHSWIADLARYYSVTSTPDYDVVTVQSSILLKNIPFFVFVRRHSRYKSDLFSVDDGGFVFDRLESMYSKFSFPKRHLFISRRIHSVAKQHGIKLSRGILSARANNDDLHIIIQRLAEACVAVFDHLHD